MQVSHGYGHRGRIITSFALILVFQAAVKRLQPVAFAQTEVTGGLSGLVTDSTGAVVPGATVTAIDTKTGASYSAKASSRGQYVIPFLPPSIYNVSAAGSGLQSDTEAATVLLAHQTNVDLKATPTGTKQTIEVSASTPQLIDTQSANLTTTFTEKQMELLPAPGGDISTIAYTAPGVLMNRGGTGFSSQGMPSDSNLFVENGFDISAAYSDVNSSGASNNTLGQAEIAEAAVVQNGYSAQYGRNAGAVETFTTKSGTSAFHGEAYWLYNSDGLNANDFFNNLSGTPREKAVSNQYATNIGGPIIPKKLFFFTGTEGLRFITPVEGYVNFPSAALQNTILNSIPSADVPLYTQMFSITNNSPAAASASPITNGKGPLQDSNNELGCGTEAGTPVSGQPNTYFGTLPKGASGTTISCMTTAHATADNLNREWLFYTRVDWDISDKDHVFLRTSVDHGQQPTFTSYINPALDISSNQPIYTSQLNDTHTFSQTLVNQFIAGFNYTGAVFLPTKGVSATLQLSPTLWYNPDNGGTVAATGIGQNSYYGFEWYNFPQGRNATQYQFVDDFSWLKRTHNVKLGANFRRNDFTIYSPETNAYGGYYTFKTFADLAGGVLPGIDAAQFTQKFSPVSKDYIALYNLAFYAQDEWTVRPNFKLTYGVRVDRTGNPQCTDHCFSFYNGSFPDTSATVNTPYDTTVSTGHDSAFTGIEVAEIQPRVGIAYDLTGEGKTVVRGGFGLFSDVFPALITSNIFTNFPEIISPIVQSGTVSEATTGSAPAYAQASAQAASNGYSAGENYTQIEAALAANHVPFSPPGFTVTPASYQIPKYLEWSLQVQHQLTQTDAVIVSYVGNIGYDELMQNLTANQSLSKSKVTSFGGLPTQSPDQRFGEVRSLANDATSNYNAAEITYKHIDHRGLTADVNYTFGHALDDISQGGYAQAFNKTSSLTTQLTQQGPSYLMYGNSDYDVRHELSLDLVYQEPYQFHAKIVDEAAAGWIASAKAYWTSGEPFSVLNSSAGSAISNGTGGDTVLADLLVPSSSFSHHCDSYWHPCLQETGMFNGTATQNDFGNEARNSFRGPHYADVDVSLIKSIVKMKRFHFFVGANAYNLFNHPNFANPQDNASLGTQGIITADVSEPTSPYGSDVGSAVSGRVVVVQGKLTF